MTKLQRVVIVGGCGHVGLPLGIVLASKAGLQVDLLDMDAQEVDLVNSGTMPFMERGADELLRKVVKKSLNATARSHLHQAGGCGDYGGGNAG